MSTESDPGVTYRGEIVVGVSGHIPREVLCTALREALAREVAPHPGVSGTSVELGAESGTLLVTLYFTGPNPKYLDDFADELLNGAIDNATQALPRSSDNDPDDVELDLRESALAPA